jgi:hypothetical protein
MSVHQRRQQPLASDFRSEPESSPREASSVWKIKYAVALSDEFDDRSAVTYDLGGAWRAEKQEAIPLIHNLIVFCAKRKQRPSGEHPIRSAAMLTLRMNGNAAEEEVQCNGRSRRMEMESQKDCHGQLAEKKGDANGWRPEFAAQ